MSYTKLHYCFNSYARARKRISDKSKLPRQRTTQTYESHIQNTHRTRNKHRKNKQRKNLPKTTRIQRHKGNNTNSHDISRSIRKPNTLTTKGRTLKCDLVRRTNETSPKKIIVHFRPYTQPQAHAFSEAVSSMLLGQPLFISNNIPKANILVSRHDYDTLNIDTSKGSHR